MASKTPEKYWLFFFIWLVALVALIFVYREFFWLALPGVVTYFCLAMGLIDPKDQHA